MLDRAIQVAPKLAVPVSNQEPITMIAGSRLPNLLQSPITARMCGYSVILRSTRIAPRQS